MSEYEVKQVFFYSHTYQKLEDLANEAEQIGDEYLAARRLVDAYEAALREFNDTRNKEERIKLAKAMDKIEEKINRLLPQPGESFGDYNNVKRVADDVARILKNSKLANELIFPIRPEGDFSKVAGLNEVKEILKDKIILPLQYPMEFDAVVEKDVEGVLLYGPPGCGKTYISKALAGEVLKQTGRKVNFYKVNGSDFRKYGANKVDEVIRSIFDTVAQNEPAILFIDEIEAVVPRRTGYGADARITSAALDSFELFKGKNVLVVAATNIPYRVDFALMGNHRLGDPIFVGPPDYDSRKEIFEVHLEGKNKEDGIDLDYLATITEAYSASDIKSIVDKAGIRAVKKFVGENKFGAPKITLSDLEFAIEETESTLAEWCNQMKDDLLDGRFPLKDRVYRKGISSKYGFIIDEIERLEQALGLNVFAQKDDESGGDVGDIYDSGGY